MTKLGSVVKSVNFSRGPIVSFIVHFIYLLLHLTVRKSAIKCRGRDVRVCISCVGYGRSHKD